MHVMFISPYACIGFTYLRVLFTYLIVFFFFWEWRGGLCLSPYACSTGLVGLVFFFFLGFDFICLMGLVLKQKLYFVQHFSGVIILICCYYLI